MENEKLQWKSLIRICVPLIHLTSGQVCVCIACVWSANGKYCNQKTVVQECTIWGEASSFLCVGDLLWRVKLSAEASSHKKYTHLSTYYIWIGRVISFEEEICRHHSEYCRPRRVVNIQRHLNLPINWMTQWRLWWFLTVTQCTDTRQAIHSNHTNDTFLEKEVLTD